VAEFALKNADATERVPPRHAANTRFSTEHPESECGGFASAGATQASSLIRVET
jgi:hypothetical protein